MQALLDKIEELRALKPDWDSYGALAVNRVSLERAKAFIRAIPWDEGLPEPSPTASGVGNVCFCWAEKTFSMDLEILPDGTLDYYWCPEPDDLDNDRSSSTKDVDKIVELLRG